MKIKLTQAENKLLLNNRLLVIEREPKIARTNKSSFVHGIGTNHLWDKVNRVWVYGNTKEYINSKMNVGRRAEDYPDNNRNVWSGSYWWECERDLFEHTEISAKNTVDFIIKDVIITLREDKESSLYNRVTFLITLSLV